MSRSTFDWLFLLSLTALGFVLTETGRAGPALPLLLGGLTLLKGRWIIDRFMGLAHAAGWLRAAVLGWLLLVLAGLAIAFRPTF